MDTSATSTAPSSVRGELFGPKRRATTIGLVLLISLVAFESMGVGTAMPALVADLGSVALYSWPFVTFMAASVLATVLGGRWSDRSGPRPPILVGPVLFGVGLLVAGTATAMPQLLVGRVLQGLGAGALSVASFVMIAAVYPERLRPAVFGLISSAWVLPALLGPPVAGLVTETLSWHWVFLGLVPLVILALALLAPAVRHLKRPDHVPAVRRGTAAAAIGAAVGVAALSWAGQHPDVVGAIVAVVALAALVPSLRVLLPHGVFKGARGIPTVVAARGLLSGTFFTVNAFLPLMLHGTHGWSLAAAGIPLVAGSLAWSASSAWQGRHPDVPRARLLRAGFIGVAVGAAGMLLVAPAWGIAWLAVPFWVIAGTGMGLGFSAVSFLVLAQSPEGTVGFNSAAAQMTDQLSVATMVGAGGALLALLGAPAVALPVLVAIVVGLAVLGVAAAPRAAG
ncbi:MAG TPA: MFS transporter [Pseudonocardia sp.]